MRTKEGDACVQAASLAVCMGVYLGLIGHGCWLRKMQRQRERGIWKLRIVLLN